MHNARRSVMLRIAGVGSSREANRVQATAAKAMAPAPSGHAVAIQKNPHMLIATVAANADNSAMPGSVCIGFGPGLAGGGGNFTARPLLRLGQIGSKAEIGLPAVDQLDQSHGEIDRHEICPARLRADSRRRRDAGFLK